MSGSESRSPEARRAAARRPLWLAAPVILVAAGLLSLTSVPDGHHAFRRLRGTEGWSVLGPGLRLRVPLLHELRLFPDEVTVRRPEAGTAEGSYAVTARLTDEAIHHAAARSLTPADYLAANVEEILGASAGRTAREIEAILLAELPRRGMREPIVSAALAGGSDAPRRTLERPIVLIGLDGADWQVAGPLIEAGRLPVLAGLRERGAWGHLRSSTPMLSPLLWTTAATGKPPDEHGIVDFLVPDPATGKKVPISSSFRRVKALWNIFGDSGLYSTFIAWWATYPTEPVRGEIISDRVAYSLFEVGRPELAASGLVHPPSLWEETSRRIVEAGAIPDALVRSIADVDEEAIAGARRLLAEGGEDATRDRLVHLMKILASTRTYHQVALDRIAEGQPDLLAVYYQGIDEVSHRFAHCSPPALPLCPPEDARRYGGSVAAFYEHQDRLLGEILSAVEPDSYVVLVSDHGFRSGGDRPRDIAPDIEGKPAKWHRPYGVAVVAGEGIEPHRLDTVTLLDIAPTVLRLAGLAKAQDMAGRALVDAGGRPRGPATIATYEGAGGQVAVAALSGSASAGENEMLENLRSLGYIGSEAEAAPAPGEEAAALDAAATPSTVTAHTNVASLHLQNGELEKAEEEFRAALALAPSYAPALLGLAEVRNLQGRPEDAFAFTERALSSGADPEPGVYVRYAVLATRIGAEDEAASILARKRTRRPDVAEIAVGQAVLSESRGDSAGAEGLLLEALDLDPAGTEAMSRLFRLRRARQEEEGLEPAIRAALRSNPRSVLHLNWLGLILERRGDFAGAEREFRKALETAPDFGGTMANLGSLYGRMGRLEEAVEILGRALRIEPLNLEARVNLGAALGKLGRLDEALQVLEKGREAAPRSAEILNALAVTHAQMGDTKKASELFRESLRIRENQPSVRAMLAEMEASS